MEQHEVAYPVLLGAASGPCGDAGSETCVGGVESAEQIAGPRPDAVLAVVEPGRRRRCERLVVLVLGLVDELFHAHVLADSIARSLQ